MQHHTSQQQHSSAIISNMADFSNIPLHYGIMITQILKLQTDNQVARDSNNAVPLMIQ